MASEPPLQCNVCGEERPADKIGMTSRMGVVNGLYTDRYVSYCIDRECREKASGGPQNESLRDRIFQRWFNRPL